jgi:hypothetical protein
MDFNSIENISNEGFSGFIKIKELNHNPTVIPGIKGVYLVLYLDKVAPEFLNKGTGGYINGKDPNIEVIGLRNKWVNDTIVLYIGKTGGEKVDSTLQSRVKQYLKFGQGKAVSHPGGRYIWQIKNSEDLVICWKPLEKEDPEAIESELLSQFLTKYGTVPFANHKG